MYKPVADPGFPVGGGCGPRRGGVDSRGDYISKIFYVKTKESGPFGGGRAPGIRQLTHTYRAETENLPAEYLQISRGKTHKDL